MEPTILTNLYVVTSPYKYTFAAGVIATDSTGSPELTHLRWFFATKCVIEVLTVLYRSFYTIRERNTVAIANPFSNI